MINTIFKAFNQFSSHLVKRCDTKSDINQIAHGVPQGSVLGPLLFLVFINDLNRCIHFSTTRHFADDTNLLYSHQNETVLRKHMNEDLKSVFRWLCGNRLSFNVGKTEFIIFRPPKKKIDERNTHKLNGKHYVILQK